MWGSTALPVVGRFGMLRGALPLSMLVACGESDEGANESPSPSPSPCPNVSPGASASISPSLPCVGVESEEPVATSAGTGDYEFTLTQPIPQAGGTQIQTADLVIRLTVDGGNVTGTLEAPLVSS
jgi:hypothetical protein